jgi:hypothetical protein
MSTIALSIVEAFANSTSTVAEAMKVAEADLAAVGEPVALETRGLGPAVSDDDP